MYLSTIDNDNQYVLDYIRIQGVSLCFSSAIFFIYLIRLKFNLFRFINESNLNSFLLKIKRLFLFF